MKYVNTRNNLKVSGNEIGTTELHKFKVSENVKI